MQAMSRRQPGAAVVVGLALLAVAAPAGGQTQLLQLEKGNGTAVLQVDENGGLVGFGTYDVGSIPATGAGTRLMWWPGRQALRVGTVTGSQWDDGSIGANSLAMGYNATASGVFTTAIGRHTTASADYSTAFGSETVASGYVSTAMGYQSHSDGYGSTALGYQTEASGDRSTAAGYNTIASGSHSTTFGRQTTASGDWGSTAMGYYSLASGRSSTAMGMSTASGDRSTSMGSYTTASGIASTAMGDNTEASGDYAAAMGQRTTAQAQASVVLGRYNVVGGTTDAWIDTDALLVAGNGTGDGSRSNALTLLKNGNLTIAGTLTQNSDVRLKTDIEALGTVLGKLQGIQGVSFKFIDQHSGPAGTHVGLLAQEVQAAFPELVHEDASGNLSVAYGNFTAVLLEAIKEQQREIEALRERVAALESGRALHQ